MSFAFRAAGAATSFSAATSISVARPAGTATDDFLLLVVGVEAVTSGPWVSPNNTAGHISNANGWQQVFAQAPSASGAGLEVWAAVNGGSGPVTVDLASSLTGESVMLGWTGEYFTTGTIFDGAVRSSATSQVSGANAAAPSLFAFQNELVIALAAQIVNSPGFGTPTPAGFTKRFDAARSSSYSNISVTVADLTQPANGTTGTIPWVTTVTGTPKGATGTIAVVPLTVPGSPGGSGSSVSGNPVIVAEYR